MESANSNISTLSGISSNTNTRVHPDICHAHTHKAAEQSERWRQNTHYHWILSRPAASRSSSVLAVGSSPTSKHRGLELLAAGLSAVGSSTRTPLAIGPAAHTAPGSCSTPRSYGARGGRSRSPHIPCPSAVAPRIPWLAAGVGRAPLAWPSSRLTLATEADGLGWRGTGGIGWSLVGLAGDNNPRQQRDAGSAGWLGA